MAFGNIEANWSKASLVERHEFPLQRTLAPGSIVAGEKTS